MMIFARYLEGDGQSLQFTIERGAATGWVASESDGQSPLKTSHIRDWRRVEAAIALFECKAWALRQEGWTEL